MKFKSRLQFVRIYFDSSTFDRITKVGVRCDTQYLSLSLQDRKAKFVDQLSAIGGTMGLLTGFSIISGVEVFYFQTRIVVGILKSVLDLKTEK